MPSFLSNLLETKAGEAVVDADAHLKGKIVALYFSSSWCSICKTFTPLLSVLYEDAREDDDIEFEVVYISSDDNAEECQQYMNMKHPNWLRVKYEQSAQFKERYRIFAGKEQSAFPNTERRVGIPSIVIVDAEGKELDLVVGFDVVKEIESKGTSFLDRWNSYKW